MTLMVAMAGKKQSGKNTVCQYLLDNRASIWWPGVKVEVFSLAGAIKEICVDILGLEPRLVYGSNDDKETLTDYCWQDMPGYHGPRGRMTARQLMQYLGTEIFRSMDDSIWVKTLLRRIGRSGCDIALVDDVRFDNEVDHILQSGNSLIFHLLRDVHGGQDGHASERGLRPCQHERFIPIDNRHMSVTDTNYRVGHEIRLRCG